MNREQESNANQRNLPMCSVSAELRALVDQMRRHAAHEREFGTPLKGRPWRKRSIDVVIDLYADAIAAVVAQCRSCHHSTPHKECTRGAE